MGAFKEFHSKEKYKKDLQKSLGLKHIGYGNYKNSNNDLFYWDENKFSKSDSSKDSKKKFKKLSSIFYLDSKDDVWEEIDGKLYPTRFWKSLDGNGYYDVDGKKLNLNKHIKY